MRKKLLTIIFIIAALALLPCLFACGADRTVSSISISGEQKAFSVGDDFTTGSGFRVTAVYSDGSSSDVTSDAKVRHEVGFDMDTAGEYMVTVLYGGKSSVYSITVYEYSALESLTLDTTAAAKNYKLGETVSYDGLNVTATYASAAGGRKDVELSATEYDVEITDAAGNVSGQVLRAFGKHTVKIIKDGVFASYDINVEGASIDTIRGAAAVATAVSDSVLSGAAHISTYIDGASVSSEYSYIFGDNYTRLTSGDRQYHYSVKPDDALSVTVSGNGTAWPGDPAPAAAMLGPKFSLWYGDIEIYGIENVITSLYAAAEDASDAEEYIDARNYSFSFGTVMRVDNRGGEYYFANTVSFSLTPGSKYAIASANIIQDAYASGEYELIDGKFVPTGKRARRDIISVTQETGDRILKNPYYGDNVTITDFKLKFGDKTLVTGDVLELSVNRSIVLELTDFAPDGVTLIADPLSLSDGKQTVGFVGLFSNGYVAYCETATSTDIFLTAKKKGSYTLTVATSQVSVTIGITVV